MNKRVNLYFAALLGAMSPICAVPALASHSIIATAMQQDNSWLYRYCPWMRGLAASQNILLQRNR